MPLLAGIRVTAYRKSGTSYVKTGGATTDSNGEFSIGGISDGDYILKFEDIGDGVRSAGTYETWFGADPDKVVDALYSIEDAKLYAKSVSGDWDHDLWYSYLASGGTVSGKMRCHDSKIAEYNAAGYVNASGEIAQLTVKILRLKSQTEATLYATTTTDSSGDFSFSGLPSGRYVLQSTDPGNGARPFGFFETKYLGDSSKSGDDVNWYVLSGVTPYYIEPPFSQTYYRSAGNSISGTVTGE